MRENGDNTGEAEGIAIPSSVSTLELMRRSAEMSRHPWGNKNGATSGATGTTAGTTAGVTK